MIKTATIRSWVTLLMVIVFVGSIFVWYVTLRRVPRTLILLTGDKGGEYYKLGQAVERSIQAQLGDRVRFRIEPTRGSKDNYDRLIDAAQRGNSGEAYLAIMQGGTVPIQRVTTIAPLYPEFIHVIVRADSGINGIGDLVGRRIALGLTGSGERVTASKLLAYYGIQIDQLELNQHSVKDLLPEDSPLEGAIVTTGIQHPVLIEVLGTKRFRLLSIDIAPAIEMADPFLRRVEVPKGLYAQYPPVPSEPVTTLATTAFLVTSANTDSRLVDAALGAIYEESLRIEFPNLIAREDATSWVSTRLHPIAHRYFHPADHLGFMAAVLESMAAVKELLLALAALIYLCWQRWRTTIRREQQQQFSRQKEHLDLLLQRTLAIETALLECTDPTELRHFLQEVTKIKINALREFTDEELRGDSTFSIFQQQCDSLINRIQLRMIDARGGMV